MGLTAYEISADGTPRKHRKLMELLPGPGGNPLVIIEGEQLFLDEIVCRAFLGAPTDTRGLVVIHMDGDPHNCAADNLVWQLHADWLARESVQAMQRLMRPGFLPARVPVVPLGGMQRPGKRTFYF